MKGKFTTLDLIVELSELQKLVGMRVNQVYDIDHKTYLIRLQKPDAEKVVLLLESGSRIHTTGFEWPKNPAPSGFSMKLRKHINNKRLESISQIGVDRVVDIQFGTSDAAYHLILELYDRGNMVLTDHEYKILNILRPRVQGEEKFLVRETYPVELAQQSYDVWDKEKLMEVFKASKPNDTLKKALSSRFPFGPPLLEHVLQRNSLTGNMKVGKDLDIEKHVDLILAAFSEAMKIAIKCNTDQFKGVIIQKQSSRPTADGNREEEFMMYEEFHPLLFKQHENKPFVELDTFDRAVDEFFSKLESQKIELKIVAQEKQAMKKLENVKKDHSERLMKLKEEQARDKRRAELIELNEQLVDNALTVMRSAIANQIDWKEIEELIKEATESNDPVASRIKSLHLERNHFSMLLTDPYAHLDDSEGSEGEDGSNSVENTKEMIVEIDIDLSAQANARKHYHQKKSAAAKEKKTLDSHSVALKSAEKKTKETLKEVAAISNINKARKVFWFEKFFWFISSENFLVIAGRDVQQNELIVKKYMRPDDVYVHADLHGASSVVIKNPTGQPVPPKTLNEAGQFAICHSVAWDNKVVASAWWVEASQVSKTAPSGEYLTAGSFMIRGKKNFLPPAHLILGFGFLFKLEESSIERHKGERRIREMNTETSVEESVDDNADVEIEIDENASSGDEEKEVEKKEGEGIEKGMAEFNLSDIKEEEVPEGDRNEAEKDNDEESTDEEVHKDESDEEEKSAFPDTSIGLKLSKTGNVSLYARGISESNEQGGESTEQIITFTEKTRKKTQKQQSDKKGKKGRDKSKEIPEDEDFGKGNQQKRGKKGKMKKLKEKYRDQDEEEKELRMQILQGPQKDRKKNKKKNQKNQPEDEEKSRGLKKPGGPKQPGSQKQQQQQHLDDEDETPNVNTEVDMLDSLTGIPMSEDELLFAVPVVAPYNTMINYKFKVKLTPGIGKRGKATKTALNMFLTDRSTSAREKDLLKSVKDQDLARNLPGKVKLSAPHLQKAKGKGGKK